jgi:hypothetical protein
MTLENASIRDELHAYVDKSDEKLLRLMYVLAKEYSEADNLDYELSEDDIKLFDERRAKRLNGESKTYAWKEAKEIITGKGQ